MSEHRAGPARARALKRLHGGFNLAGGLWPLLSMRSFEAVLGPKTDRWLVRTVAGLLIVSGATQLSAPPDAQGLALARRLGMGTAGVLASIDAVYGIPGRISRMYLIDGVAQTVLIVSWLLAGPLEDGRRRGAGRAGGRRRR